MTDVEIIYFSPLANVVFLHQGEPGASTCGKEIGKIIRKTETSHFGYTDKQLSDFPGRDGKQWRLR